MPATDLMTTWTLPEPGEVPAGSARYGFECAGLLLVPPAGMLTELVAQAPVFPVPRSVSALVGVLNLHGHIVPVLDPDRIGHARLNLQPAPQRVLVFGRGDQRIGVRLKGMPQLLQLSPGPTIALRPQGVLTRFLTHAWTPLDRPHQVWWEFDPLAALAHLAQTAPASSTPRTGTARIAQTEVNS